MTTDKLNAILGRLRQLEKAAADLYDGSFPDADRKYCHYLNSYPDAAIDGSPSPPGAHNTPEDLERFREFARTLRQTESESCPEPN